MSTGQEEPQVEEIDKVLPEDHVDPLKVRKLDDLAKVANANSTQVRSLQRRLVGIREDPEKQHLIEPLENAIAIRQQRSIKLIHRRNALQQQEDVKKRSVLEEALRPTIGKLNVDRREILNQILDLQERVSKLRGKYTEQTTEHRRLEAKLKQWDSFLLMMAKGLDGLAPLPTHID
jgi:predicted  nucleic acid-binding Zn-ribbon protein